MRRIVAAGGSLLLGLGLLARSGAVLAQPFDPALYAAMRWRMIGPFRGGRTVAISGVPGQPNVFYMAPNDGGVWKTSDYGRTWAPIFDGQPTQSIGALAVAPSNPDVIYVGSGEGLQRPDLSVGDGIYKSTDAGRTWEHLGLRDGRQIGAILVDPRDPDRLFVAVLGHPYGPNEERGVYRSGDGGRTFQRVLWKDENTGAIDLAFDPSNPQTIFAVLWAARQAPWEYGNEFSGPGSGLYRSDDGGARWRAVGRGLPTAKEGLGRIGIGIAPSDPMRMYALVEAPKGGLFRSDDEGETFRKVPTLGRIWGRGSDFACVRVDPRNPDVVYSANISLYRSEDAGTTFSAIKGAPGGDDYHTIWINPDEPRIIALAVDQGATISVNGGQTWSSWYNQPTAQFFHVITDDQFPYWVYGGQQESGSAGIASRGDDGSITFRDWYPVGVEEYGYVAPDPLDPRFIYGGKVTRFDRKTHQTQDVGPVVLRTGKYRFDRTAPLIFSPVDPHVLYFASQVLWRTSDGGKSWDEISPDLTRPDPGIPPTMGIYAKDAAARPRPRGVIYSIGPSPRDGGVIWVGSDDGLVHLTRDGGKSWQDVTPPELTPWSKVTQIDASHFDAQTAYVSVSRFRLDDLRPMIFRTRDGGKSWQEIVSGLPEDAPVNVVREDPVRPGLLFAGTESAVWVSFDDGDHWQPLQLNLPATSIRDLVVHGEDLVVATHGRSFWILDDIAPLRQIDARTAAGGGAVLFRPPRTYRVRRSVYTDTPLPPEEPAGQNPPDGAIFDYFLKSPAAAPVTLEITDASGRLVRRFSSADRPPPIDPNIPLPTYWIRPARIPSAEAGAHRFVWDLRLSPPDSVEHEYPISAVVHDTPRHPQGPAVLPGEYTVTLRAAGQTLAQPLSVRMDPRVPATQADLERQFALEARITEAMRESFAALSEVQSVRHGLASARGAAGSGPLADAIADLDRRVEPFGGVGEGRGGGGAGKAEGFGRLNKQLLTVLSSVDMADAAPTPAQAETFDGVRRDLDARLGTWEKLKAGDLAALNARLRQAGLPEASVHDRSR
jgi:photosystem II stability/assembly factor-like uncharacterized protein